MGVPDTERVGLETCLTQKRFSLKQPVRLGSIKWGSLAASRRVCHRPQAWST